MATEIGCATAEKASRGDAKEILGELSLVREHVSATRNALQELRSALYGAPDAEDPQEQCAPTPVPCGVIEELQQEISSLQDLSERTKNIAFSLQTRLAP